MNLFSSLQLKTSQRGQIRLKSKNIEHLRVKYELGRRLGKGGCGSVYLFIEKNSEKLYACKVLSKRRYSSTKLKQEIQFLADVAHPNIVSFHEYYESKLEMFIVMEYCNGGELFQVLREYGKFDEFNGQTVIKALLSAVKYLQTKFIIHRDIKLENILLLTDVLKSRKRLALVKEDVLLVDFGLAKRMSSNRERTKTRCGSKYYVAPEVWLGRGYGMEADLWSIGVVMYMLLTNTPPFYEAQDRNKSLEMSIATGNYAVPQVSGEAKVLLKSLLTLNPSRRVKASDALKSSWFRVEAGI